MIEMDPTLLKQTDSFASYLSRKFFVQGQKNRLSNNFNCSRQHGTLHRLINKRTRGASKRFKTSWIL